MTTNFDVQAVDLSGVLNKPVEDKAKQIPDPATYHLLCMLPQAKEEYDGGLLKASQTMRFFKSVPPVTASLHSSPGLISTIGIGEAPIGLQGTFSLWESMQAIKDFAYKGAAHQKAIAQTSEFDWYAEELFARFAVREMRGMI